ncbi:MAG: DUF3618 domain-containing protein [Halomonas sp.]|nr:DUF3618 domain-containing protein [Halomonas sp.]MCC5883860.1 DUF3618 domain-containing protein [Halomonas sp.]
MSQDGRRRSDEIENEIHQARARLDDTLHQIEVRLSPERLMNMTYDYLRQGGGERIATSLGRTIKENPLPVLVTGIGLGWLVLAQRNSQHDRSHETQPRHAGGYPGSTIPDSGHDGRHDSLSGAGTTTLGHDPAALGATPRHDSDSQSHGGGMTSKAQHMAEEMRERAERVGGQVKERVQHMGDQVRDRASHFGEQRHAAMHAASQRMHEASSQTSHFVKDHPLVAGALGVAVGAVLGSLFAPTRLENEYLGDLRDRALDRAEEAGQEQLERAEEKIHQTAERLKDEARSAKPSNAPHYGENDSSEERFAKAGSSKVGTESGMKSGMKSGMESGMKSDQSEAAKKGGSSTTPSTASTPSTPSTPSTSSGSGTTPSKGS